MKPKKISEHINKIWGKPSEWWLKEDIQSLKTKFLNVINCDDPDPVKKYYKTLQNIYKDRHEKN